MYRYIITSSSFVLLKACISASDAKNGCAFRNKRLYVLSANSVFLPSTSVSQDLLSLVFRSLNHVFAHKNELGLFVP